jgi:hypothetical protein
MPDGWRIVTSSVNERNWDDRLEKWFRGLEEIAARHPELYPHGIISGVLLSISQGIDANPRIAASVPEHVVTAVLRLHKHLFCRFDSAR